MLSAVVLLAQDGISVLMAAAGSGNVEVSHCVNMGMIWMSEGCSRRDGCVRCMHGYIGGR